MNKNSQFKIIKIKENHNIVAEDKKKLLFQVWDLLLAQAHDKNFQKDKLTNKSDDYADRGTSTPKSEKVSEI